MKLVTIVKMGKFLIELYLSPDGTFAFVTGQRVLVVCRTFETAKKLLFAVEDKV